MDLIAVAEQRRAWHLSEAERLAAFISTARELEGVARSPERQNTVALTAPISSPPPAAKSAVSRPKSGIGADTLNAAEELVRALGPMSSRELLPFITEKGIEVGGKDAVATLSARISHKGDLVTHNGKWHLRDELDKLGLNGSGKEETADIPTKATSAASLFNANEGERRDAAALAS